MITLVKIIKQKLLMYFQFKCKVLYEYSENNSYKKCIYKIICKNIYKLLDSFKKKRKKKMSF